MISRPNKAKAMHTIVVEAWTKDHDAYVTRKLRSASLASRRLMGSVAREIEFNADMAALR